MMEPKPKPTFYVGQRVKITAVLSPRRNPGTYSNKSLKGTYATICGTESRVQTTSGGFMLHCEDNSFNVYTIESDGYKHRFVTHDVAAERIFYPHEIEPAELGIDKDGNMI